MRKRNVSISFRRGRYVVDYRDRSGRRWRKAFLTMSEAETHKRDVELSFEGFLKVRERNDVTSSTSRKRVSIKEAINQYRAVRIGTTFSNTLKVEQYHFESVYLFLVNEHRLHWLDEIALFHLDAFQSHLLKETPEGKGLATSTVNRMFFGTFSPFFGKCVAWQLLEKSPMVGPNGRSAIKRLPERESDIKVWSPKQIDIALKNLEPHVSEVVFFLSHMGCRPVDAGRLTWGDVDLEARVVQFMSFKGGAAKKIRKPMSDELFERLNERFERSRRDFRVKDTDPVFLTARGRKFTTQYLVNALAELRSRVDPASGKPSFPELAGLTNYGLRHSFIDGLVSLNVHARDVQLLAGHSKFETTIRYTHRNVDHLRAIMNLSAASRRVAEAD